MYVTVVAILVAYSTCVYISELFISRIIFRGSMLSLLVLYFFLIVFNLYFMIISAYRLLQLAKNVETSQLRQFNHEKKWFWMYAAFLATMIFTWIIEIYCWREEISSSLSLSLIADLIKLFSAGNIFIIFVIRKSIQELLFNKYRSLRGISFSVPDVSKI